MVNKRPNYTPPKPALWKGREDSLPGERFFQQVHCVDLNNQTLEPHTDTVFIGFACDEGIKRNGGRIGATLGPDALREQLAKLPCHSAKTFIDVGNMVCTDQRLESAQEDFGKLINACHQKGLQTIALGGGHEMAWGHFQGLVEHYPKIGIINIDAHFDIRPLPQEGLGTSGTPFTQIKHYCDAHQLNFDYACLGIQPLANTQSLFDKALEWGVQYLSAEEIHTQSFAAQAAFLDDFLLCHDHIYLSICLDAFAECYAPGVSAPQATGLSPWQVLPLLKYIAQTGKVVSIDIAELSPPLDQEQKTARLAAVIIAELLHFKE